MYKDLDKCIVETLIRDKSNFMLSNIKEKLYELKDITSLTSNQRLYSFLKPIRLFVQRFYILQNINKIVCTIYGYIY